MNHSYPAEVRRTALSLLRNGVANVDVARRLGIPPGTIGAWKHEDRRSQGHKPLLRSCPICDKDLKILDKNSYSYLLGLYLGDGHIIKYRQWRAYALTIACADAWPGLIDAAEVAVRTVLPHNKVCRVRRQGCTSVKSYSQHWPCLFPQHGPGRKHERRIVLADWQSAIVRQYPDEFIRGLIHSDGWRGTNWATRPVAGETKRYGYPRYLFVNESDDIRNLFTDALDLLGIEWRRNKHNCISVAKRDSVAAMDTFVGPKY